MSASPDERRENWRTWIRQHGTVPDGLALVGFVHQCGYANVWAEDLAMVTCGGCGFLLDGRAEAEPPVPLYAPLHGLGGLYATLGGT